MRKLISTGSPFEKTAGYSRAVVQGDWCFVSGTTGYDYATMTMPESVAEQTRNCMATIAKALETAGFDLADIVRVHYYVTDRAFVDVVFPILGGFLFYGLHIPLKQTAWIGLLVVLTLLGVVATAIQRLRDVPDDQGQWQGRGQQPRGGQQPPRQGGSVALNSFVYGLAAVVAIGAIGYSVKSAETQKFPGYTALSMTPVVDNPLAQNLALLSNNVAAQQQAALAENDLQGKATQAHLVVTNHQGTPEQYQLKLLKNAKVIATWPITLNDGQSWQKTIAWSNFGDAKPYALIADLYQLPNTSTPIRYVNNGVCAPAANLKALPAALRAEDPCGGKS